MSNAPIKPKYLSDGETKKDGGYNKSIFETLKYAYSPFMARIILCICLGITGRGLLLANTNVIGYWVDNITGKENILSGLSSGQIIALLAGMALAGFIMTLSFRVSFSRLSAQAISSFYDEVTLRTSRLPMSFFDNTPAGRIITRFSSDYGNVFRLFGGPLAEFISIIFDLTMMVILVTVASPIYLIFVVFIGIMNYLVFKLNQNKLRTARRELSASRSPSIAHFAETTQGASTIRSFRRQQSFGERFERLDRYFLTQKMNTTKSLLSFSLQMNSLTALLLLITGVSAYFMVEKGWATVGSVGVAFAFIALSGNTVQMFFEWLTQFEEAMIGVERLDQYMRMDIERGSLLPSTAQFATGHPTYSASVERYLAHRRLTEERNASVQVQDVWFRYREDLPWVLKGVNFEVKAGERLGIVGRTGSGKSSLIQALFYLYPIDKGQISINTHLPKLSEEASGVDLNLYRKSMAFIAQEPILFQGSLRFNLDIDGQIPEEKLLSVLEQVGLREWVLAQPGGLEMKIEERGKNLSLGERQLLCMARCLLQQAPIVIMDEATSSVDPQSEEIMVRATEEFFSDRTQIIIAHRLSTLAKCDRILWLQNGEIVALGPTDEVLPRFKNTELV
ncbi:ATP-binding cassette domain-containing protein [Bdellovibrio bacteriovorus]|uniref:ABC transporter ATP-binding protein n=1 Tax=Bdellovibrio bacteriovorus TaxID=959 RepID=UPI0021CF4CCF|nr:ABC transporter transmembrane domain-containing protein [Bdellovibrio bacteriovorus]UXR63090.1 ATP-binding cassette domain-containing protein [Bdellovibrio bacteriovorus]